MTKNVRNGPSHQAVFESYSDFKRRKRREKVQEDPIDFEPGLAVSSFREDNTAPMRGSVCSAMGCNVKATIGVMRRQQNLRWDRLNYCDKHAQEWWLDRGDRDHQSRQFQCYPMETLT